jgi:hypothetical protein
MDKKRGVRPTALSSLPARVPPKRQQSRGEAGLKSNAVPVAGGVLAGRRPDLTAKWRLAACAQVTGQRRRRVHRGAGGGIRHEAVLRAAAECLRDRFANRGHASATTRALPASRPVQCRPSRRRTRCVRPICRRHGAAPQPGEARAFPDISACWLLAPSCRHERAHLKPRNRRPHRWFRRRFSHI